MNDNFVLRMIRRSRESYRKYLKIGFKLKDIERKSVEGLESDSQFLQNNY